MRRASKKKPENRLRRPPRKTKAGTLLRATREKLGLTLLDVEAATGLLGGGISHFENGRSIPAFTSAIILCTYYKLPLTTLAKAVEEDELRAFRKRLRIWRRADSSLSGLILTMAAANG